MEVAEALHGKMQYFDELDRVAAQFHGAALDVDSDRFLPLLQRLDDCISCAPATRSTPRDAMCSTQSVMTPHQSCVRVPVSKPPCVSARLADRWAQVYGPPVMALHQMTCFAGCLHVVVPEGDDSEGRHTGAGTWPATRNTRMRRRTWASSGRCSSARWAASGRVCKAS